MKAKFYLLLATAFFSVSILHAQTQLPLNGDMEEWVKGSVFAIEYDSLVHWDTPNRLGTALGVGDTVSFKEESIVHSGDYAIKLETESAVIIGIPLTVPGTVSTGIYEIDIANFEFGVAGGMAIDCKPEAFEGFYHYLPFNDMDTLFINIQMFTAGGDTIADIDYQDNQTTTDYVPFNIPITYSSGDDPAIVQISITASSSAGGAQDGTLLYVDDIVLTGGDCVTGIFDAFQEPQPISLWPNPSTDRVNFEYPGTSSDAVLTVTDISGKKVMQHNIQAGTNSINTSQLSEGFYILRIFENHRSMYKAKFEIKH